MELPSFDISHAGIRGQWLTFTLGIEAGTALRLQDSYLMLHELGRHELPADITVQPGRGFTTEVRYLLPPVSAHFPHIESNAMRNHAARLNQVLWLTEQAEHHGKVVFRLGEAWGEMPVIVRV